MITIKLPYKTEDQDYIKMLRQEYSNVVRYSYNRFKEGQSQKDIRLLVKSLNVNLLNSWLIQCAIKEGEAVYKKNGSDRVIFGSKKHFYRRLKGLITSEQWKDYRLSPINIQGEALQQGNRSFKLDLINNNSVIFKVNKDKHIKLELPKLRKNYKKLLFLLEQSNQTKQGEQGLTYSVRLNENYIYISFEQPKTKHNLLSTRYIGIDLNPNEIGLSIKEENRVLETRKFVLNINENSHHKVLHELYEISKKISSLAKHYKCKFVFVEKLTIKSQDHQKGRKHNKAINNQWIRNKFIDNLEKRITVFGGHLYKINPA